MDVQGTPLHSPFHSETCTSDVGLILVTRWHGNSHFHILHLHGNQTIKNGNRNGIDVGNGNRIDVGNGNNRCLAYSLAHGLFWS